MPALTRRRDPDAHQERWRIYYGDVHVDSIVASACQRTGKRLGAALLAVQKLRKASRECSYESCLRRGDDCDAGRACLRAGKVGAQIREADKDKTPQEKEADKAAQRAYERSLGNIPDKGPTDPWGVTRSTDAPKAAAKTPAAKKPPAKTGSTAN